ncbi:MAG: hypothetical protein BWY02_02056 [bacterium ADurb.Bin157]|nr:MAG: hypothetical protein BWY02_02056 [bacterium ADurb.Bin157]
MSLSYINTISVAEAMPIALLAGIVVTPLELTVLKLNEMGDATVNPPSAAMARAEVATVTV